MISWKATEYQVKVTLFFVLTTFSYYSSCYSGSLICHKCSLYLFEEYFSKCSALIIACSSVTSSCSISKETSAPDAVFSSSVAAEDDSSFATEEASSVATEAFLLLRLKIYLPPQKKKSPAKAFNPVSGAFTKCRFCDGQAEWQPRNNRFFCGKAAQHRNVSVLFFSSVLCLANTSNTGSHSSSLGINPCGLEACSSM